MKKNSTNFAKSLRLAICGLLLSASAAFADEPKLTLYLPFDGSIAPAIAKGNAVPRYGRPNEAPGFTDGISGKGFLTGGSNQNVTFDAAGNISPEQWTITFWLKGLPGAKWNVQGDLHGWWELNGEQGEIMWLYKYLERATPWLLARPKPGQGDTETLYAPAPPEEQWQYWAVSWRKGSGAFLYLNGQFVGQLAGEAPNPVKVISIGQPVNKGEQNKIIDEFKIYDTALDAGSIAHRYWQEGDFALNPALTVTRTGRQITIDGKIDPAEWQNAAGFAGLVNSENWSMTAAQTRGRITYDDQNLYLALHSDNPPEARDNPDNVVLHGFVKRDTTTPGPGVLQDDNFAVDIMPQTAGGTVYSLHANVLDVIYDYSRSNGGGVNANWESGAKVKSVIGMDGWSLEAAIPLKSLGVERITDGTIWHVDFSRVWKLLSQHTDSWAPGSKVIEGEVSANVGFGKLHFTGEATATASVQEFSIAKNGQVTAQLNLSNPGNTAQEFTVTLAAGDKTAQEQKVTLQSGENQQVTLQALLKESNGALVGIAVRNGSRVLLDQKAPLILEQVGQLNMWKYPSREQIRLGWVIQGNDAPATLSLNAEIKDAAGKVVQNVNVAQLPSEIGSSMVDVKSLAPGKYTLAMQIKKGGDVLQQQTLPYEKQPLPSWLGNTLGISDKVPPPFTDIQVDQAKDAVSIWGRTYDYAGRLLPQQIVNQGKEMLAAPMQFVVKASGGAAQASGSSKAQNAQWTKIHAVRSDSLRSQTLGPVDLETDSYVEFDGMTWMNLKVSPRAKQANVDGLAIEIPLKAEWAELIKPYDDYSLQNTGKLPAKGWKGNASSMPWVGNGNGGFQLFQESTANWIGSKTSEIVPDGKGSVVLRVHLIDQPTTLGESMNFAFGWVTSPVKSAPRDHRDWRMIDQWLISNDPQGTTPVGAYAKQAAALNPGIKQYALWWTHWWWMPKDIPNFTEPVPVPDPSKTDAVRNYNGITVYGAPYGRLNEMGVANPWFEQFGDEWDPSTSKFVPDLNLPEGQRVFRVSHAARSLQDFYAWGTNELLKDGKVQGLYFDVSRPIADSNIYHGAGVVMPDGSIEPTRDILGMRRTFQRIYTLMKEKHPQGRVFYHMSGEIMLPLNSFVDAMVDGENYNTRLDRPGNLGYEDLLSLDQFRTEYSTQNNFGPASVLLPEFKPALPVEGDTWKKLGYHPHAQYVMGLLLMHDSNVWWANFPPEILVDVYSSLDKTGWNSSWKFVPYWNQQYFTLPQGINASVYESPDGKKNVLVVMNTSGKDQQIELPLALGKNTLRTAKAVYPDKPLSVRNGKITSLQIPNNNFQMVLLEK